MGERMIIQKGMIVSADICWYVVVEAIFNKDTNVLGLHCICDHANNIHYLEAKEIHSYLTLTEIGNFGWSKPTRGLPEVLWDRTIPNDVIVEVLSGKHDDRFKHWGLE